MPNVLARICGGQSSGPFAPGLPRAISFATYLEMLQIDVGDELVLESASDIETVKSQLASILSIQFEPPSSEAHGYPEYRAALGDEENPEWIWLSPNTVPRGFVRETDRRYNQLKDLMPGNAARFPELPSQCYILNTTDGVRSRLINTCATSHIAMSPLREYLSAS